MENKRYWNADEVENLSLEDLESVAGGWTKNDLNAEDRKRYEDTFKRWGDALIARTKGKISAEEFYRIDDEFNALLFELDKKYK